MISKILRILKVFNQAFGEYRFQIIGLTVLGFFSGLLEGIGINALIPLFSFATGGGEGGNDPISRVIEKVFLYFNVDFNLKYLLIFICLLFVLKALVLILCGYLRIKITADYEEQTREKLFRKTLKANWACLLKQKLGFLSTVLMIDARTSASLLQQISGIIMLATSLLMYILIAINISFYITFITLILGAIIFLLFKPLVYKTKKIAYKTSATNKQVAHFVDENILGMKTIKTASVAEKILKISKRYFAKLKKLRIKLHLLKTISGSLIQPISLIFICLVFAFSYKSSNFNFAALIAVVYLIQRIFVYIQQTQTHLQGIAEGIPYLESVLNYKNQMKTNQEKSRGSSAFSLSDSLEFKSVSFSYDTNKEILSDINFSIKKGELVGLIGPSGAGKTTIVDLILCLFYPTTGKILLDGKGILDFTSEEWEKNVGYVSQDIFLKNDTFENNIKFYDDSISDEDMVIAAKMANIYDFIEGCPDKFSTLIGERGIMLSAGQRQRIVIARVLAKKPKLLILDEATSA
ncbi:MAG: ABC transporter ATP-binding protein, partial [Patescibacteria group bacterium]|nr:ABC transporter ATP-binding protein [Patescibacteria group bacterium]